MRSFVYISHLGSVHRLGGVLRRLQKSDVAFPYRVSQSRGIGSGYRMFLNG
jgi:hypothetical protein